jgi:hypothetical protein
MRFKIYVISILLINTACFNRTKIPVPENTAARGNTLSSWVDRTGQSQAPTAGEDIAMIYDPRQHRILLFGGKDDDNQNSNELWALDLVSHAWQPLKILGDAPPASEDHSLIYDPIGHRMIFYGGEDGPTWNHTWSFDLQTLRWTDLTDSMAPRREDHTAIYDSQKKRMVVFGGQDNDELSNEIWAFDLDPASQRFQQWQKLPAAGDRLPVARYDHAAVYDSLKNRMVIYGGWDDAEEKYLDDTWAFYFEPSRWQPIKTKKSHPPRRRHAVGVYHSTRNWFIIQGGFGDEGHLNDVWALDLAVDAWLNITPGPQPRMDHAAVYDPRSQRLIIYGGDAGLTPKFHDLWELQIQPHLPLEPMLKEAGARPRSRESNN